MDSNEPQGSRRTSSPDNRAALATAAQAAAALNIAVAMVWLLVLGDGHPVLSRMLGASHLIAAGVTLLRRRRSDLEGAVRFGWVGLVLGPALAFLLWLAASRLLDL